MRGFGSPLGAFIEAVETISEMKKITVFLTLFSLIVLFPTVSAITFVVNQTANCTAGDSYHSTIQSAINDANTGDLIIVCNGTYNENVNVDKPLNIQSYSQNPSDTIVNATNSGDHGFEITADSVNLSGFEVRGAREDLIGGISLIEADYCSISGNSLSNNRIGIYLSSSSNNLVTNNTASTDLCSAMKIGSCAGVRLDCGYGSSLPTQNNTVENNTVSAPGTGDGIALHGTGSCQLTTNNTVDNNMDTNSGVGVVLAYVSNNTVSNNVLNFNRHYGINLQYASYNIIRGNTISSTLFGIYPENVESIIIENNRMSNITRADIRLDDAGRVLKDYTIRNNTIETCIVISGATIVDTTQLSTLPNDVVALSNSISYFGIIASVVDANGAQLTIYYSEEKVKGVHINEHHLRLYHWSGLRWIELDSIVNTIENYIIANVTSFSPFAIAPYGASPDEPITPTGDGGGSYYKPKVVILANSIDLNLSSNFTAFLENQGIDIIYANATNFSQYKNQRFVIIFGGPDAYDGLGEVVRDILNESEQTFLRNEGNRVMYVKKDIWRRDQIVMIIVGSDREETRKAGEESKLAVRKEIKGY